MANQSEQIDIKDVGCGRCFDGIKICGKNNFLCPSCKETQFSQEAEAERCARNKKYILITFYNRGTTLKPIWEVYGHVTEIEVPFLEDFKTKHEAIEYAHSISEHFGGIPVLLTDKGQDVVRKLM